MKIGIDIDGVLTDFETWQLETGEKFFSQYGKTIKNRKGNDTMDIFDTDEETNKLFWDRHLFDYAENEPARENAAEIIKKLSQDNHQILIITSRSCSKRQLPVKDRMRKTVKWWLENNDIYYDQLIFANNKLKTCLDNQIDVMIEDSDYHVMPISEKLPVICFNAGYNEHCQGENIFRVDDWRQIYQIVQNI